MNRLTISVYCCLLPLAAAAQSSINSTDVPVLSDYAWGFPIHLDGESSFYSVQLPLEVNQSVTDPELRDAGVYNGAGNPVPRVFEQASDDVEHIEHRRQLPMLPLYATTESRTDDIKLLFERDGDSSRLELSTDGALTPDEGEQLTSYIVDTRQFDDAFVSLELNWVQVEAGFIGRVTVDGSNDLESWKQVGSGAIADLREDAASVIQRSVKLQKSEHDFLRIRWRDLPETWSLSQVQGVSVQGVSNIVRKLIMLEPSGSDPEDGGRIFNLGGTPKTDQLRLVLPELNTVISARIYSWSESQNRWMQAASGSFHHIGRGDNTVMSEATSIRSVRSSRFKVVITRGQPTAPMRLEIGWRPDSLLFLARGSAPFTLAAGRALDAESQFPQQKMYGDRSIAGLAQTNGRAVAAILGTRYPLGGPDRMRVVQALNWRTYALWFGLALGVAFVGIMASKVIRELKAQ